MTRSRTTAVLSTGPPSASAAALLGSISSRRSTRSISGPDSRAW
jgi:hypothetical protein